MPQEANASAPSPGWRRGSRTHPTAIGGPVDEAGHIDQGDPSVHIVFPMAEVGQGRGERVPKSALKPCFESIYIHGLYR